MAYKSKLLVGSIGPIDVGYARIGDFESVEPASGWYAWFYVPGSLQQNAFELHRYCHPMASVEGLFNLDLHGWLSPASSTVSCKSTLQNDPAFLETIRALVLAFSAPLYIGISKNLKQRLKIHRAQLLEAMDSGAADLKAQNKVPDYNPDSDEESRCFGDRVGAYLSALSIPHEDLYVKYVLTDRPAILADAEKLLNYSLTPKFGKR